MKRVDQPTMSTAEPVSAKLATVRKYIITSLHAQSSDGHCSMAEQVTPIRLIDEVLAALKAALEPKP